MNTIRDTNDFHGFKVQPVSEHSEIIQINTKTSSLRSHTNIRKRIDHRDRHSKWTFGELREFVTYKAKSAGVLLKIVNPKDTSRKCPRCHHIDKENRKTRDDFECCNPTYGYKDMADYVALRILL